MKNTKSELHKEMLELKKEIRFTREFELRGICASTVATRKHVQPVIDKIKNMQARVDEILVLLKK